MGRHAKASIVRVSALLFALLASLFAWSPHVAYLPRTPTATATIT